MKKIFALILVLVMLFPMVMSCKKEEGKPSPKPSSSSTPTESSTPPSSEEDPTSSSTPDTPSPTPPGYNAHGFSSKETIMTDWSGKTLNVLVTRYGTEASAPWGQVELNAYSFGEGIGQAFDERQIEILELYGVNVNWVAAKDAQAVNPSLADAELSGTTNYDIAIPRVKEVQQLVSAVYNMRESDYIDFTHSYYSQAAFDAFTVADYTLFANGDHDFADEQSSYTMLFNKEMLAEKGYSSELLYEEVKNGNWTYDALTAISTLVSSNTGAETWGDEDTYGFGIKNVTQYFYYFGVFEADKNPDSGLYRFALDLDTTKVEQIIGLMQAVKTSTWGRTSWGGDYGSAMHTAFEEGRLLFFNDVTQKITELSLDFDIGIVPFPKLNTEQDDYIVPINNEQITVICIPKVTQDRAMSEYFVDVLSWTGGEYTVKAYYEKLQNMMDFSTAEEDIEIIKNYVFANIAYDIGALTAGTGTSLAGDIKGRVLNGENFTTIMQNEGDILIGTVQGWNNAWGAYDETEY